MTELIEVELYRVVIQEKDDQQFLHLRVRGGERAFPIVVGFNEATEIHRKLRGIEPVRPMTHDLIGRMLYAMSIRLERVVITELRDATFYANLCLEFDGELKLVDCRPSDAICLAVQLDAPLYVSREVLDLVAPG